MSGRIEGEKRREESAEKVVREMPGFANAWYLSLRASGKTSKTCLYFLRMLRCYLSSIDDNVADITPSMLTLDKTMKYFISTQTKIDNTGKLAKTSDSYQQNVWGCLNNFFKFMKKTRQIEENPMEFIDKPKNHDLERINQSRKLLTENDFTKILNAARNENGNIRYKSFKSRDVAILALLMTTGMRETALAEINIEDIDFDKRVLTVVDKGNKVHKYVLADYCYDSIITWINDRDQCDIKNKQALFLSRTGNRIDSSSIMRMVYKYSEAGLGYKISPHKLRSGFCSIYYNKVNNIEAVRRAVGHSSIQTTQRYVVTPNKEREEAAQLMASLIS